MRVCDRCREKKSFKTYRDQRGGEIELCEPCDEAFIKFLEAGITPAPVEKATATTAGKSAKK